MPLRNDSAAIRAPLALAIGLLCVLGTTAAVDAPPYGHPDFYPSPERPIGFRGDGNGAFPGASPVTGWWEGTPEEREAEFKGKRGMETGTYLAMSDAQSRNIVWKTEMPSWANSHPIVVGDKVFTLGEPDLLICSDARSGAVLWTRRSNVWSCLVEDPERAEQLHGLFEIYLSLNAIITSQFKDRQPRWSPEEYAGTRKIVADSCLPRIVAALQRLDPQTGWAPLATDMLAGMDLFIADAENYKRASGMLNDKNGLKSRLARRIQDLGGYKVDIDMPWGNMIGWCMSVPVSDGRHVYASFGQGQTACWDLEGELVWQRWMDPAYGRTDPVQSPLLRGRVLVDMHGGSKELRGVDAATGELLWTAPTASDALQKIKGGYYVGSHKILTLRDAFGTELDVVVTTLCNIIRLSDGKVVGRLPWTWNYGPSGGPSIFNVGQIVYRSANGDGGGCPFTAFELTLVDRDTVNAEVLWHFGDKASPGYHGQVAHGGLLYLSRGESNVVDGRSGEILAERRRNDAIGGLSNVLAGTRFIWAEDGAKGKLMSRWGGRRFDGQTALQFHVADLSDPRAPKRLDSICLLGGENVPRFPAYERFIPELYEQRMLWGNWDGLPAHFMHVDTGILPHGNRLFVRSVSHLYCIGDPALAWHTPADAPVESRTAK